jgi:hypothetical protein
MHSFACEEAAHVDLEVWEHMNHDFQAFGTAMPQSTQVLSRLGQVIETAWREQHQQRGRKDEQPGP